MQGGEEQGGEEQGGEEKGGEEKTPAVLACGALAAGALESLFAPFGLLVAWVEEGESLPGSYWGAPEAGLLGNTLWLRADTPVHSALHEGCHWICMDEERRETLDTDAGGEDLEESAVCYLQILLADRLEGVGMERLMSDMDAWGYSFRLGSTREWFEHDAEDAKQFLKQRRLWVPSVTSRSE